MDSFDEKLNTILSSPEAMDRIMTMAQALGPQGGPQGGQPFSAAGGDGGQGPQPSSASGGSAGPTATSASGGDEGGQDSGGLGALDMLQNLDPKMISKAMQLMHAYNEPDDQRANLLKAVKPYLRRERWGKVEKATQYMKLARVAKIAMRDFFKGE